MAIAGITIKTNLNAVASNVLKKLNAIKDKERVLRPVSLDAIRLISRRIHVEGRDSNGLLIGNYSAGYMVIRQKLLPPVYTRGKNKGKPRKNYDHPKRLPDTKVIASLTRELQNDYSVTDTPKGYGVGLKNEWNFKKKGYVEATYGVEIWLLTKEEREFIKAQIEKIIANELNN